jgi:type III restriction enzyme
VDFIITVEALKEGWDCPFAYVLCSVANIGSATDIEQLLGRVLRMPYAETRTQEALNRAYCHVSSQRFGDGARALTDTLIEKMGFEPDEAAAAITQNYPTLPGFDLQYDLFNRAPELRETVDVAPDLVGLPPEVAARVQVEVQSDGTKVVTVQGEIPEELEQRLVAAVPTDRQSMLRAAVQRHRITHRNHQAPAARGEAFPVPRLFLNVQGELELAEEELILDLEGWTLNTYAAELTPEEFAIRENSERWEVDIKGEKVTYKHLDQQAQIEIGALKLDWSTNDLARWLDDNCHEEDITQPVLLEFCRKIVTSLTETRGIALNDLLRFKYQLVRAVHDKIGVYRRLAYASGYQRLLFGDNAPVEISFSDDFAFEKRPYPAAWFYQGAYQFKKHFFGGVGELANKGEEFECARLIDTLPQVKYWIRNLASRPQTSFWLPTSTDRFYPDFVVVLNDGRIFVIEYKGAHIATTDDTKEKRSIGELWAAKSNGKGLFLMAEKHNAQGLGLGQQLEAALKY